MTGTPQDLMDQYAKAPMLFGDLFYGLRKAGLRVGVGEWMGLMEALRAGVIRPDLTDFYHVSRALLVKSEAHFDLYDQVFLAVFGGRALPVKAVQEILDWLAEPMLRELTEEMIAAAEHLPLDELRKRFEERLEEQRKRHDGGNRWIGTGGTSPFGNSGQNPAGVRVGGSGGGRSAVQIASARNYKNYRHDRVLDVRQIAVALKKLRRLTRRHSDLELDVEESIDQTCRNAGELTLEFTPPRKNDARVLLLMDTGGSMDPYAHLVERLFSAAHSLHHWKKFEAFAFHNCVYTELEPGRPQDDENINTGDLLRDRPSETFLIMVGDAYMAPSELLDPFGAIYYDENNRTPGVVWLHRLRRKFPRAVWLNPIPPRGWQGYTIRVIKEIFPMFPLTLQGIDDAVRHLTRGTPPPLAPLGDAYPQFAKFDEA